MNNAQNFLKGGERKVIIYKVFYNDYREIKAHILFYAAGWTDTVYCSSYLSFVCLNIATIFRHDLKTGTLKGIS